MFFSREFQVEEFSTHGEQEYYEHHILQEHDLTDADRHLVELVIMQFST